MVLALVVSVVVEGGFHFRVHLTFLLIEVHHDVVVLLLLFCMDCFNLLHLRSEVSQLLDLWGELLLSIFNLSFDLVNSFGDFLEGLILLIIKELFLI
jgi:NADH:ubiquinone oxidoreductase subunit K